jgi:glucosyl-3-phosphoglycerate synthase
VARAAGAAVYAAAEVLPSAGRHPGKGEALWKSLFVTGGDILVFVDADLTLWGPHFVTGLLGPLLLDPEIQLVKGFYDRLLALDDQPPTLQGGRVTELVARPLLNLWWPDLAAVIQPLAGEWAARRSLMTSLPLPTGYGVEIATLLDTYARHGLDAIAQVDLGLRAHPHQSQEDLGVMAAEILAVALERLPQQSRAAAVAAADPTLHQYVRDDAAPRTWRERPVPLTQRPPADTMAPEGGRC